MDIIQLLFIVIILTISISFHEYAHAWMADRLGDPTPRLQGRLTLNPLSHIDPLGFFLAFIIRFGRGRAVQYNPHYLKNPLKDELKIALAGPAMNILLTLGGMILLSIYQSLAGGNILIRGGDLVTLFWIQFCYINIALAVFNMIPIPPLDGYRLVKIWFPSLFYKIEAYGQYFFLAIAILTISGAFGPFVGRVSEKIFTILYSIVSSFL